MKKHHTMDTASIMISLAVNDDLFDHLTRINESMIGCVDLQSADPVLLKQVVHDFPTLCIGSSLITTVQQLEECHRSGINFMTSPGFLPHLVQTASIYEIPYIPGIATLSEAMQVSALGHSRVRLCPSSLSLCHRLSLYLPHLRLYPSHVSWHDHHHYLALPNVKTVSLVDSTPTEWMSVQRNMSVLA